MSVTYKVEDIEISAVRDRAMFNTFAGNNSYVIANIGQELAVSYSDSSFVVELGTGEAVICGGSMTSTGTASTLTLGQNQSGYLVIRIDLSQTGENICRFYKVTSLVQQNINGGSEYIYDLPLYRYTTNGTGVSSVTDVRRILSSTLDLVPSPTIDSALSSSSTRAVQNKVINTALSGKAPTSHASSNTTYGLGTTSNYGHVKTINALTQGSHLDGTALSAYQGKILKGLIDTNTTSISTVNDTINALDYTGTGARTKTVTKVTQTNGKVSATFTDLTIPVEIDTPQSNYTGGGYKVVYLTSKPTNLRNGYIYLIKG